jgi:hypothetical protein
MAVIDIDSWQELVSGAGSRRQASLSTRPPFASGRDAVTRHCQSGEPLRDCSRQPTVPLTQSESAHISGYLSRYRSTLLALQIRQLLES